MGRKQKKKRERESKKYEINQLRWQKLGSVVQFSLVWILTTTTEVAVVFIYFSLSLTLSKYHLLILKCNIDVICVFRRYSLLETRNSPFIIEINPYGMRLKWKLFVKLMSSPRQQFDIRIPFLWQLSGEGIHKSYKK